MTYRMFQFPVVLRHLGFLLSLYKEELRCGVHQRDQECALSLSPSVSSGIVRLAYFSPSMPFLRYLSCTYIDLRASVLPLGLLGVSLIPFSSSKLSSIILAMSRDITGSIDLTWCAPAFKRFRLVSLRGKPPQVGRPSGGNSMALVSRV